MKKTHPTPSTEGIDLRDVQRRLGSWYDEHARALPWREDVSAYHVMLSEIILQQTRVGWLIIIASPSASLPYRT